MPLQFEFLRNHFVATLLIVSCLPAVVAAQTGSCKASLQTLPSAPELKGFQLGMTMEQAKANAPLMVFLNPDPLGSTKTTINPAFDARADKSKFQDVRTISLDFLDDRLVSLWIGYDPSFKWSTVEDFVTGISKSLLLPNAWSEWRLRGKQMRCADFELTVSVIAQSPSFRIVDTAAAETLAARRTAAAEAAEATSETEEEPEEASEPEEIVADRKTKIYYPGNCRPQTSIVEANRVTFKTNAEAEKAGYKLSRSCS